MSLEQAREVRDMAPAFTADLHAKFVWGLLRLAVMPPSVFSP